MGPKGEYQTYYYYPEDKLGQDDQQALGGTVEILSKAALETERAGADLIVLYIPSKVRVYSDFCTGAAGKSWGKSDLPERLGAALAVEVPKIRFVDLTYALQAALASGVSVYFKDDTHWTPAGHMVAAQVVASHLEKL
jgi:hypothetical protein